MKELSKKELRKLQKVELDILIEFDRICRKYDIKYALCGGTLIGAVRHNGFIPWDDDIDVHMSRDDYDKFIKYQKKELDNEKYYLDCIETNSSCGMLYAKLKRKNTLYVEENSNRDEKEQNIWIDIFPLDNISNNKIVQKFFYTKIYCLKIILMYKYGYIKKNDKKTILKIIKILSIFFNKEKLKKKLLLKIKKYNRKNTKYITCYSGVYLGKEIFNRYIYDSLIESKFENNKFYITKFYDKYLKSIYGDYMKLPPIDKQSGHHYVEKIKFPK